MLNQFREAFITMPKHLIYKICYKSRTIKEKKTIKSCIYLETRSSSIEEWAISLIHIAI